jgi:hypothetical protein
VCRPPEVYWANVVPFRSKYYIKEYNFSVIRIRYSQLNRSRVRSSRKNTEALHTPLDLTLLFSDDNEQSRTSKNIYRRFLEFHTV